MVDNCNKGQKDKGCFAQMYTHDLCEKGKGTVLLDNDDEPYKYDSVKECKKEMSRIIFECGATEIIKQVCSDKKYLNSNQQSKKFCELEMRADRKSKKNSLDNDHNGQNKKMFDLGPESISLIPLIPLKIIRNVEIEIPWGNGSKKVKVKSKDSLQVETMMNKYNFRYIFNDGAEINLAEENQGVETKIITSRIHYKNKPRKKIFLYFYEDTTFNYYSYLEEEIGIFCKKGESIKMNLVGKYTDWEWFPSIDCDEEED